MPNKIHCQNPKTLFRHVRLPHYNAVVLLRKNTSKLLFSILKTIQLYNYVRCSIIFIYIFAIGISEDFREFVFIFETRFFLTANFRATLQGKECCQNKFFLKYTKCSNFKIANCYIFNSNTMICKDFQRYIKHLYCETLVFKQFHLFLLCAYVEIIETLSKTLKVTHRHSATVKGRDIYSQEPSSNILLKTCQICM